MAIYPPIETTTHFLIGNVFGRPNTDWLTDDIDHLPFSEVIFWARRIMTEQLEKPSKYSMQNFQKMFPELVNPNDPITKQYEVYMEWRKKQPPEGDLRTNFGKRVERWFECPAVVRQFMTAYKTYGWFIANECKEIARKKQSGSTFLDVDWKHLIRCRQVLSDLDAAMYRMELHNAGAWDLDYELAQEFHWVEMLWVFAQQDGVDLQTVWSAYDKANVRNNPVRYWWWDAKWDFMAMPDDLEPLFDNGTVTVPLDGGDFITTL